MIFMEVLEVAAAFVRMEWVGVSLVKMVLVVAAQDRLLVEVIYRHIALAAMAS